MEHTIEDRFGDLYGERSRKPRREGKTMVIGDGLYNLGGMHYLEDMVGFVGPWIDAYKFQRGALGLQPASLLREKLDLFDQHNILAFTGGNSLEAAVHHGVEETFFDAVTETGCPGIEVSSTSIEMELSFKCELIERAIDRGLHVHAEIGKKESETDGDTLSTDAIHKEVDAVLEAGADIVILEMEQLEAMGRDGDRDGTIDAFVDEFGRDRLMFEVPLKSYYEVMAESWWFIERFGPEVNLGNLNPEWVMPLEQQRRGLGQNAFQQLTSD